MSYIRPKCKNQQYYNLLSCLTQTSVYHHHLVVLAVGVFRDIFRFFQLRFEERNTLVVRKAAALQSFAVSVDIVIQCTLDTVCATHH